MLETLRRIVQEVNDSGDLEQALQIIVRRVKQAMNVDLCSVYLSDNLRRENVLMATEGLNPETVGNVRLSFGQGLTGIVGEREEVVNVADAATHPDYIFVPLSGEESFHAYLGVPIIHQRVLLGVLVLQCFKRGKFDEDVVTFLVTVAAQLAGAIAHANVSGEIASLRSETTIGSASPIPGQAGAAGVGLGQAFVMYPSADLSVIPDRNIDNIEEEIQVFEQALDAVGKDINQMIKKLDKSLPAEDKALFDAYLLMLDSDTLVNGVIDRIKQGNWASGALRDTIQDHLRIFDAMDDSYLRERSADVRDLGRRILVRLQSRGDSVRRHYPDNIVLVGEEITASMLAEVPMSKIVGVVSVAGSRTSHVAILARGMGIAAVMGADLPVGKIDGKELIVDGYRGHVYVSPTRAIRDEFKRLAEEEKELSDDLAALQDLPPITPDGNKISLQINSGLLANILPADTSGAEGIGLYRTEFPFMIRDRFPGEEEQYLIYREVLQSFANRPVTLRTLDVGGDKSLPYFPIKEDNPFLGWRGIRITLDHPEIFLVQLRAMLRASE